MDRKMRIIPSLRLRVSREVLSGLLDEAQSAHVSIETFAEQILEAVIPNEDRWDDLTNGGNQLAELAREYPRMSFVHLLQAALMDYTDRARQHGIDAHGFILEPENEEANVTRSGGADTVAYQRGSLKRLRTA